MITLDAIRTAVQAPDPYTQMDSLIRAEMAAGRKVQEIFDAINPLVDTVLDTPGLTEDGEEAFLGALDALTGNCHRDSCYYDPPNTTLPTEEEIATLPRWARVAFTERCSRRRPPGTERAKPAKWVGRVNDKDVYSVPTEDIETAYGTMTVVAKFLTEPARSSIRRDFDGLARLAEWQKWTDDTPVAPDVFGPLWPEGPPVGWPADPEAPSRVELPLELHSRAKYLEQRTEDEAVNLFNAINAYYIARTGTRLTLEGYKALAAALETVGV